MKKELIQLTPVVLLVLAIGLSPSFVIGTFGEGRKDFELRPEDILLAVFAFVWIIGLIKAKIRKIEQPPLFFPIIVWLLIGFVSVLSNWLFQNIGIERSFFFFLKEIEFFVLFFYLFYHVRSSSAVKLLFKIWIAIGVVHALWIIIEVIFRLPITYYYGPTLFIEPEGTFPGSGFVLLLVAFMLQILIYYYLTGKFSLWQKFLIAAAVISPIVGVFSSGSRTSFYGAIFMVCFTLFLYIWKARLSTAVVGSALLLLLVGIAFTFLFFGDASVENRLLRIEGLVKELNPENEAVRSNIWQKQLSNAVERPLYLFLGFGKATKLGVGDSHSQYIRNFIETGILGSLAFLFLMFAIIKKAWSTFLSQKDTFLIAVSAGALVITMTMLFISLAVEAFIVVKVGEIYWFLIALSMIVLYQSPQIRKQSNNG